jgi:S1-C subfamily serine protease
MRRAIFITLLSLPLVSVAAHAENVAVDSKSEIFGVSSEDVGGSSYLGVDTRDITPDRLGALKLKEEQGVEVTMVDQDAPAGKAGLKEHDVILTVNGAAVESVEQLRRVIRETPPGRVVTLGLSRDGQAMTLKVQLA